MKWKNLSKKKQEEYKDWRIANQPYGFDTIHADDCKVLCWSMSWAQGKHRFERETAYQTFVKKVEQ